MRVPGKVPTPEGSTIMPTVLGGTNWYPPSYSPRTGWFYIPLWENTGTVAVEGGRPKAIGKHSHGRGEFADQPEVGRRRLRRGAGFRSEDGRSASGSSR